MKKKVLLCLLILPILFSVSCKEDYYIGQETIIKTSTKKEPKWIKQPPKHTHKYFFFVGEDYGKTSSDKFAYQTALAKAGTFFATEANTYFERKEANTGIAVSQVLRQEQIKNSSKAALRGAEHAETYWEKIEKVTEEGFVYYYNVYVLVRFHREAVDLTEKATNTLLQ